MSREKLIVDRREAAIIVGLTPEEIGIVENEGGPIRPLAGAANNQKRLYATKDLLALEPKDLADCVRCLKKHWKKKNASRKRKTQNSVEKM